MQRKKKRSIIFELHSIPIRLKELYKVIRYRFFEHRSLWTKANTNNSIPHNKSISLGNSKRLYLVSYSIPLSCMVVLLLGSIVFVNPSLFVSDKGYAVEVGDIDGVSVDDSVSDSLGDGEDINNGELADEEFSGPAEDDPNYVAGGYGVDMDGGIMPLTSTATFSIGGQGRNEVVETAVDKVAYRSHTVSIGISNAEDYYLMISGDPNLTTTAGSTVVTGITGTNVTGANIPAGQWGYGWDYTNSKTDAAMTYVAMPAGGYKLTVPKLSNNATSFTGKLNFAVKFPSNSVLGAYTSNVTLTLVVTPKAQTGSAAWRDETGAVTALEAGTTTMQGIKSGFCKNNSSVGEGWTIDLQDNRGTSPVTYTIYKAADGNCWMGQNLALTGPLTLTSTDSDVSSNWSLPASTTSWNTSDNNVAQMHTGSTDLTNWKDGYGNYYSWCAATADTCKSNGSTAITSGEAASSICPKGWKLPSGSGNQSYTSLITAYKSSWLVNQTINDVSDIAGYYFGFNSISVYKGANFWPAAGYFANKNLYVPASEGRYWSRSAQSEADFAYFLFFDKSNARPANPYGGYRTYGCSVRCVADY